MRRRGEVAEVEQTENVVRIEDTEVGVLLDLDENLEKGFFGQEEEAEAGRVRVRGGGGGGDRDGADGDGDVAGVSESEFFEEDHGAGVGRDPQRFDLGGGEGEEREENDGEREE